MEFEQLESGIYRLCVAFEEIYTTVFLLRSQAGCIGKTSVSFTGPDAYLQTVIALKKQVPAENINS